jgi:hypothetical protein
MLYFYHKRNYLGTILWPQLMEPEGRLKAPQARTRGRGGVNVGSVERLIQLAQLADVLYLDTGGAFGYASVVGSPRVRFLAAHSPLSSSYWTLVPPRPWEAKSGTTTGFGQKAVFFNPEIKKNPKRRFFFYPMFFVPFYSDFV